MVSTHPVQYAAPQYRRLAADERVELTVLFLSMASVGALLTKTSEGPFDGTCRCWRVSDGPTLRIGRRVRACTDSLGS